MNLGASVRSRDWDEVVDALGQARVAVLPGDGSTHVPELHLNEPRRGWAAFRITFRAMFLEEWRETVDFAQARQIILFPLVADAGHRHFDHRSAVFGGYDSSRTDLRH